MSIECVRQSFALKTPETQVEVRTSKTPMDKVTKGEVSIGFVEAIEALHLECV